MSLSNFYKDIAMILYFPLFQTKGALQDFGVELNSTRSNLQDADVKLQKYVHDNILIIFCYSLDRRSGLYDDPVVINPGNVIKQRWKA